MRLWKVILASIFAIIVAIQAVAIGWAIVDEDTANIVIQSLFAVFALYLLLLTALAVNKTYSAHSLVVIHLCALLFVAVALIGTITIIPSSPIPVTKAVLFMAASVSLPQALWYANTALYFVAVVIAFTIPRGPALHYPSERIYSEKTLMDLSSKYDDNVCGIIGTFIGLNFQCLRLTSNLQRRVRMGFVLVLIHHQSRYAGQQLRKP